MPRHPTAVQTPGEPTTAAPADQPAADAFQAVVSDTSADAAPAGTIDVSALQAQIAAQNAQISALMSAVTQMQDNQARPTPKQAQDDALPDINSVDIKAINDGDAAVLTKQGWVVPVNLGANPKDVLDRKDAALQREALIKLAGKSDKV